MSTVGHDRRTGHTNCPVCYTLWMILNDHQEQQLARVADTAQTLAQAKQVTAEATVNVKAAIYEALDADVPLSRVARAAGLQRSLIYHWLGQEAQA